jgi:hypothetical protein
LFPFGNLSHTSILHNSLLQYTPLVEEYGTGKYQKLKVDEYTSRNLDPKISITA